MDTVSLAFEALKQVKESSNWMLGLAVSMTGGVFTLLTARELLIKRVNMAFTKNASQRSFDGRYLLLVGLLVLLVSILWASILLAGIPDATTQLSKLPAAASVYSLTIPFPYPSPFALSVPLWVVTFMQSATFGIGVLLLIFYFWVLLAPGNVASDAQH